MKRQFSPTDSNCFTPHIIVISSLPLSRVKELLADIGGITHLRINMAEVYGSYFVSCLFWRFNLVSNFISGLARRFVYLS